MKKYNMVLFINFNFHFLIYPLNIKLIIFASWDRRNLLFTIKIYVGVDWTDWLFEINLLEYLYGLINKNPQKNPLKENLH